MYTKTIEYKDYSGNMRKEDFQFNLSEAEIMEMELSTEGGYDQWITRIYNAQNTPELIKLFKSLILMAYGERSLDGKKFLKKDPQTGRPLCEEFEQTAAYPVLFMELATNAEAAAEFINKVIPENAAEAIEKAKADGSLDEAQSKIYNLSK
jgi:predicted 3-demethylubiquinone-9 3-methyltransferase (glyoxalase superfamily)